MGTGRLEAFSDGVIAVIITIMVLELHAPHETTWAALAPLAPSLVVYALSFLMVAIMWLNHHNLLHHAKRTTTGLIWSNSFLLFWMSLIPFDTAFLGEHHSAALPIAAYGATLAFASLGFLMVQSAITCQCSADADFVCLMDRIRLKAFTSAALYALAALTAWWSPYPAMVIFVAIPLAYFWPDPKMRLAEAGGGEA